MTYRPIFGETFERNIKRLKKRYPHVKDEVREAIDFILKNPTLAPVIPNDFGMRKLRLPNRDARRGKSGGYRLIYYVEAQHIYLLLLYSKSDQADTSRRELQQLLREIS
jgi:mRNA-degrading endonuclease RelE of RelBE toxin-antitoxin system